MLNRADLKATNSTSCRLQPTNDAFRIAQPAVLRIVTSLVLVWALYLTAIIFTDSQGW
jgi:hypothetical protein